MGDDAQWALAVDVREAARRVGVSRSTLYLEIAEGRLQTAKIGRRRLVPIKGLEEWFALHVDGVSRPPLDSYDK